ncbi:hypothetical protein EMCRGX_G011115 [Ephydatia muelleri]|eukprot:Em0006g1170a
MYAAAELNENQPNGSTAAHRIPLRVTVLLTCALSIVGSALIVLSYVCFKNSRSKARQILVHLSVVNLGAGLSDFLGGVLYFQFNYEEVGLSENDGKAVVCKILASVSLYCSLSSILWSATLAAHLYFVLTGYVDVTRHLRLSYVFDYGLPVLFVVWFLSTHRLGYNRHLANCNVVYETAGRKDFVATVFGNDLLTYGAAVLISALSVSVRAQIREEMSRSDGDETYSSLRKVDTKFAVFPAAFVVLRIWRCLQIAWLIYNPEGHSTPAGIRYALAFLSGIGHTAQGITNAFLFVLLSAKVRKNFSHRLCPWTKHTSSSNGLSRRPIAPIESMDSDLSNIKDSIMKC